MLRAWQVHFSIFPIPMTTLPLSPRQISSIRGLFFGQAVGDALGLGTEFMSKREVTVHYPHGLSDYCQIIRDTHRSRWQPGEWTDDTEQFLCLCDAIVESGGVDELAFARKLHAWYRGEPRGIGNTVLNVVSWPGFMEDPHSTARALWLINDRNIASNGAIMRSCLLCVKFGYEGIPNRLVEGLRGKEVLERKLGEFVRSGGAETLHGLNASS